MALTDQTSRIREGEELPLDVIDQYLKAQIPGLEGVPRISQFPGGASNLTYLLEYPEREFVLRRPPRAAVRHHAGGGAPPPGVPAPPPRAPPRPHPTP